MLCRPSLGALFSATISASIRGWNRISVFIAFGSITAFFITLQLFINSYLPGKLAKGTIIICALFFGGLGLYDQTVSPCQACNEQAKSAFISDKKFIEEIESLLPVGSAVYQLPYMPFPEVAPLHRLSAYDLSIGFLHSKHLLWSYAGMKGRKGNLFYRSLSMETIEKQLEVITKMDFSGIYIDRRGFKDNGVSIIAELIRILGRNPTLTRDDKEIVFFEL